MHILFLTHRLPYAPNRGDRIRAYHMLRALAARHRVTLISLVHDEEEEWRACDLARIAWRVYTARVRRGHARRAAISALLDRRPLTHALLGSPELEQVIWNAVLTSPPDVVLAYCSSMARAAMQPPLDAFPCVLDMVDVDSEKWRALGRDGTAPLHWIYRREARVLRRFEEFAVGRAGATLVVNERERRSLASCDHVGRIHIVPNGVDLEALRPQAAPAPSETVVFCGVMNYQPNVEAAEWLAGRVWPLVRRERPDAVLRLVGADPIRRVRALASADSRIEVTGSVIDPRPYLWSAASATAPLRTARGVQNKVLEAIAAGLPAVVTTPVWEGLPAEALPACSRADSAEEFAEALVALLQLTPAARRGLARCAAIDTLGWRQRLANLDPILESVAARTPWWSAQLSAQLSA